MKTAHYLPLSILAVALSSPAMALSTNKFIHKASESNLFEVESSKLALDKAQNPEVKKFAQQMIDDHDAAGDKLKETVSSGNADQSQIAGELDSDHQKMLNRLKMIKPADFDKEYVSDQKDAHKDAVKLFNKYSSDGDNAALKKFAADTLPTLQGHLDEAKKLSSSM